MTTALLNTLIDNQVAWLNQKLVTEVSDETKAGLVRGGNLQENPLLPEISILVKPGDDKWPHILAARKHLGIRTGSYEIGDDESYVGSFEWLRFYVELEMFFISTDRDESRISANIVLSRAKWAINVMQMPNEKDDFGSHALHGQVAEAYIVEGGGTGTFIWRGYMKTEFLTENAYVYA